MQTKMNGVVKTRVLMVCLGNICRSPLAEGVLKHLVQANQYDHLVEVDSAGTSAFHVGKGPDQRSIKVALNKGIKLQHRGRQLTKTDFTHFDHILVMDETNLSNTLKLANDEKDKSKVKLITEYDLRPNRPLIVPDPYWGDMKDFEKVQDQLIHCCEGWLATHFKKLI